MTLICRRSLVLYTPTPNLVGIRPTHSDSLNQFLGSLLQSIGRPVYPDIKSSQLETGWTEWVYLTLHFTIQDHLHDNRMGRFVRGHTYTRKYFPLTPNLYWRSDCRFRRRPNYISNSCPKSLHLPNVHDSGRRMMFWPVSELIVHTRLESNPTTLTIFLNMGQTSSLHLILDVRFRSV